ncbi:transposase [Priestia megaterium]|nr:transposase [Priestia megaterium]
MKRAYFSKRIYKDSLSTEYVDSISHALLFFNRAKHFAYQRLVLEKRSGSSRSDESLFLRVKKRFALNDYYANSAIQEAKAIMTSQDELTKLYSKNKEAQIKSTKKKIKQIKSRLTVLQKIKASFIKGKPTFNKTSREQKRGNFFIVQFKKQTDIYYHKYQFEHEYLDVQVKYLKSRLGRLLFRVDRLEKQLHSLKTKTKSVVFGSKKLFKAQFTVGKYKHNRVLWLKDFEQARYHQFLVSGRKDAKHGNFVFVYDQHEHTLHFQTPNGVPVALDGVSFPYGQEKINQAIQTQFTCQNKKKFGKPVAWSVEDHQDYYIIKCLIDEEESVNKNYSKADGLIGVDCNMDHFAVTSINQKGQLTDSFSLNLDIVGKTSGQITKIIEAEAIILVDCAVRCNKPIAVEKLNTTTSKVKNKYGHKKANLYMSMFAYKKMLSAIKNRAEKMGVAVFEVNPAYTSQIGKIKYMKRLGISIHEAASYVIARRAMGYKEKLPPVLHSLLPEKKVGLHHWAQWKWASDSLSGIHTNSFYQIELFDLDKFVQTEQFFPSGALTDLEEKSLAKLKSRKSVS